MTETDRTPITKHFRTVHRQMTSTTDCRGCTQPTCSDPKSAKSAYQACWGMMRGMIEQLNAKYPGADARIEPDPEYPNRHAVTVAREEWIARRDGPEATLSPKVSPVSLAGPGPSQN